MLIVSWFARVSRGWAAASAASTSVASTNAATVLLQSAQSMSGLDPHEAQRLRGAAQAWLSVVR